MLGISGLARVARAGGLLLGLLVLVLSVVTSAVGARDKQLAAQDSQLGISLGRQVDALHNFFERARTIQKQLTANPAFADFYQAPGTLRGKVNAGGPELNRVNDALAFMEKLSPGAIESVCFIDQSGTEIAHVLNGVRATAAQLRNASDEPFLTPTLALGPGATYQAREYVSEDTQNTVVSMATVLTAGKHRGVVRFEISLDLFRFSGPTGGMAASIVDAATGEVVMDTRTATTPADSDGSFLPLVRSGDDRGVVTQGTRRIAFERFTSKSDNANDWYIVVSAPMIGGGWTRGLGVGSLALVLGALLTILVSGASWWAHLRSVRRSATYDALTGLPNRALFTERVRAALRGGRPAAVLAVDLLRFKEVNELLGHCPGDQLLKEVAARLVEAAPASATVARLGGDDFALLLPGVGGPEARVAAERIIDALQAMFVVDGVSLHLEAAVGVAVSQADADAAILLRHADAAMQLAEEHNNGVHVYATADDHQAPNRLALLADLRRALDADDQITLHYQPKVDLSTGALTGVEALVRWHHPTLGRLAPDTFIPLAETTSLIRPLTTRVLEIAVQQAMTWQEQGRHIPVAVNLSTRCLVDATFADGVFQLLRRIGLQPALLELEITESMIMTDPDRAMTILRDLRDGGIRLSVDDFGTGHSSMAYLRQLPVHELKIDRSFVREMSADAGSGVLVRSAIALGHNLGLSVVAEGVEDEEVVAALRDLGCDVAQGYHLGRPMPVDEFATWLAHFTAVSPALQP